MIINYKPGIYIMLVLLLLAGAGCSKKKEQAVGGPAGSGTGEEQMVNTDHKVNRSYNLVPPGTSTLVYMKNLDKVRKTLKESNLVSSLKDNYIYQDFKYKYFQDTKLFFVTLNLNLDKILDMVNKDFLYGRHVEAGSFIIAHATLKTRILNMVFNIITGTAIEDKEYQGVGYRAVAKASGTVYYSMLGGYLTICDSSSVMESIIDTYISEGAEGQEDLDSKCGEDDIYVKAGMKPGYNTYDILPDLVSASFTVNTKTGAAQIGGYSEEPVSLGDNPISADILKIIPKEFALFYYKRNYPLQENLDMVISSIKKNATSSDTKKAAQNALKALDSLKLCKEGVCLSVNSLGNPKSRSLSPQFAVFLEMKDEKGGIAQAGAFRDIFSFVLGGGSWSETKESKYTLFTGPAGVFSLIVTDRYVALCNDKTFAGSLMTNIKTPGPSLYDTFAKEAGALPAENINFACINPERIVTGMEPLFKQYISSRVTINKSEYDNGFGQLFTYVKEKKPLFISLSYNQEEGRYSGQADFIK